MFADLNLKADAPANYKIVRMAVFVTPPLAALIVADLPDPALVVLTEKTTDERPAGTVTVAGTVADDWLLERVSLMPPVGAIAFK